jgi:hypothetical protein
MNFLTKKFLNVCAKCYLLGNGVNQPLHFKKAVFYDEFITPHAAGNFIQWA